MLFGDIEAKITFLFSMIKELACKNIDSLEHNFKVFESAKYKHECLSIYPIPASRKNSKKILGSREGIWQDIKNILKLLE